MPQIHIVSGFLGSGKTSFLKALLYHQDRPKGIALIENEFGKVALDKAILKEQGQGQSEDLAMYEIAKGCVCCTVQEDFQNTLYLLLKTQAYEHIFIEPTGVALPSEIKKQILAFRQKQKRAKQGEHEGFLGFWKKLSPYHKTLASLPEVDMGYTFHLLDAENYFLHRQNLKDFFDEQTRAADFIFVNRFERLAEDERSLIAESVKQLQGKAKVFWHEHIQEAKMDELWQLLKTEKEPKGFAVTKPLKLKKVPVSEATVPQKKYTFDTDTLFLKVLPSVLWEQFLRDLKEQERAGLYRVKGLVLVDQEEQGFRHLEYTPSTFVLEVYPRTSESLLPHLTFIGEAEQYKDLLHHFQPYLIEEKEA